MITNIADLIGRCDISENKTPESDDDFEDYISAEKELIDTYKSLIKSHINKKSMSNNIFIFSLRVADYKFSLDTKLERQSFQDYLELANMVLNYISENDSKNPKIEAYNSQIGDLLKRSKYLPNTTLNGWVEIKDFYHANIDN